MSNKHMIAGVAALGIAGAALPHAIQAQTSPAAPTTTINVIQARKAGQALMGGVYVGLLQAAKNKLPDVKPFAPAARSLTEWEPQFITMFPPGTEHGDNTKALPAVWSDRAGFEKAAERLTTEATKLASIASSGDQAAFATQVQAVGEACTACHKQFRAR